MLDVLHACLATVAGRTRIPAPGGSRDALMRLGIALAIIIALVGALDRRASGMDVEVAQAWTDMH